MNSKSSTFNLYHATQQYQPKSGIKTISLFHLIKPFLAPADDVSRYAETIAQNNITIWAPVESG